MGTQQGLNGAMDLPIPTATPLAAAAPPPFLIRSPSVQSAPLVFASSHSGRSYSPEFLAASRLDATALRRSEDSFVDELFDCAPDHGVPLIAATFPRAYCDPNREMWELDPVMFSDVLPSWVNTSSARVGAGLGTIARVVASGEAIYRRKLSFMEAEERINACWAPYHRALASLLAATQARFGGCLLVDCHSMPAHGATTPGRGAPDIVLGDAHGTACAPGITRWIEQALSGFGYDVRRNDPYAGGYVTRHYGRPRDGSHAIQIEVARSLYMDEARFERSPAFDLLHARLSSIVAALAAAAPALLQP